MKFYYDLPTSRLMRQIRGGTLNYMGVKNDGSLVVESSYLPGKKITIQSDGDIKDMYSLPDNVIRDILSIRGFNEQTMDTVDADADPMTQEALKTISEDFDLRKSLLGVNNAKQQLKNILKSRYAFRENQEKIGAQISKLDSDKFNNPEYLVTKIEQLLENPSDVDMKTAMYLLSILNKIKGGRKYAIKNNMLITKGEYKRQISQKQTEENQRIKEEEEKAKKVWREKYKKQIEKYNKERNKFKNRLKARIKEEKIDQLYKKLEEEDEKNSLINDINSLTKEIQDYINLSNAVEETEPEVKTSEQSNLLKRVTEAEEKWIADPTDNTNKVNYRSYIREYIETLIENNAPRSDIDVLVKKLNKTFVKDGYSYIINDDNQLVSTLEKSPKSKRKDEDSAIIDEIELKISDATNKLSNYWKNTTDQSLEVSNADDYIREQLLKINLVTIKDESGKNVSVSPFIKNQKEKYTKEQYTASNKLLKRLSDDKAKDKIIKWGLNYKRYDGEKYFYYDGNTRIFDDEGKRIEDVDSEKLYKRNFKGSRGYKYKASDSSPEEILYISSDSFKDKFKGMTKKDKEKEEAKYTPIFYETVEEYIASELFEKSGKSLEHIVCADPEITKTIFDIDIDPKDKESISVSDHLIDIIFTQYVNTKDEFKNILSSSSQFPHDVISIKHHLAIEMKDYESFSFENAYNVNIRLKTQYFNKLKEKLIDLIESKDIGYNALNEKLTEAKKLNEKLEIKRLNKQINEVKKEIESIIDIMTNELKFDRAFYVNNKYLGFDMTINKFTKPTTEELNQDIEDYYLPMKEEYIRRVYDRQNQIYTPVMSKDHKITSYKFNKNLNNKENEITKIVDEKLKLSDKKPYKFVSLITLKGAVCVYDYTNDPLFRGSDTNTILMFFKGGSTQSGFNGVSIPVDRLMLIYKALSETPAQPEPTSILTSSKKPTKKKQRENIEIDL